MTLLRVELRKLGPQGGIQVLFAVCAFAPMVLAIVLGQQDGLPKDTLLGRYVKDSGFALPLLVLGFSGRWGFPLLAALVAGPASRDGGAPAEGGGASRRLSAGAVPQRLERLQVTV